MKLEMTNTESRGQKAERGYLDRVSISWSENLQKICTCCRFGGHRLQIALLKQLLGIQIF